MKIAGFQLFRLTLPIAGKPYSMSSGLLRSVETVVLKLTLDTGETGWGETCPLGTTYAPAHAGGAIAALEVVLPHLIGTQAAPRPVHAAMDAHLMGHAYAKAAVDIALYDALGHHYGVPVSTLLGGALSLRLPAYHAIGIEPPQEAARIGREKAAEGYTRLQLKAGGRAPQEDIAAIRLLGEALEGTGTRFAVDANRGWNLRDAALISNACRDTPCIIEQPCSTLAEVRQLRPHLHHPLYLDESLSDLDAALEITCTGLADGFGVKITRMGGLAPTKALRDLCEARNLPHTSDDSWGGDIIAAACLHMGTTVRPDLLDGVWIAGDHIATVPGYPNQIRPINGFFDVPQTPGLGVTVDEAALGTPVLVLT